MGGVNAILTCLLDCVIRAAAALALRAVHQIQQQFARAGKGSELPVIFESRLDSRLGELAAKEQKLVLVPVIGLNPVDAHKRQKKLDTAAFAGLHKQLVEA
jgi:hypothetical protein